MMYRCGECGARFGSQAEVEAHCDTPDADGDRHDGTGWRPCDDQIAIVARKARVDSEFDGSLVPWSFHGTWQFSNDIDFAADESIGNTVRHLLRAGYVEVRVLHLDDANALYAATAKVSG
jgi:hypothetical protein